MIALSWALTGLKLGRQAAWRPGFILDGVVKLVGGTVQAVAVFKSNCEVLGLWLRAQTRSGSNSVVKLLGGRV